MKIKLNFRGSLLNKHESRIGDGFSGFDVGKMPWDKENFFEERDNLISILLKMKNKSFWADLGYEPTAEISFRHIDQFVALLTKMRVEDVCAENAG